MEKIDPNARIQVSTTDLGVPMIREGNYGFIALRHELRSPERGGGRGEKWEPCLFYLLTGCHVKTGRFPTARKWQEWLGALPNASYSKAKGHWTIRMKDLAEAREANRVLMGVLKSSMRDQAVAAQRARIANARAYQEERAKAAEQAEHPPAPANEAGELSTESVDKAVDRPS